MSVQTRRFAFQLLLATGCLVLAGGRVAAGESPWSVGVGLGRAEAEASFGARHPKQIDDVGDSAAVTLGYEVNRYLAIEAGYQDLGSHRGFGSPCREADDACIQRLALLELCVEGTDCAAVLLDLDADFSGLSLAAVPRWPIGERLSLRGKVGVAAWDGEISGASFGRIETLSGEGLLLGIGVLYELPSGFGLSLQHDELDLDVSSTVLGVSWRF